MIAVLKTILTGFQILCYQGLELLRLIGLSLAFFSVLILMALIGLLMIGVPLAAYWFLSLWIGVIPALVLIVVVVVIVKSYELGARR